MYYMTDIAKLSRAVADTVTPEIVICEGGAHNEHLAPVPLLTL